MAIEIVNERYITDDGERMRKLVDIKALGKDELPAYYTNTVPSFWVEEREDGRTVVCIKSLEYAEMVVGEVYPADKFYHFIQIIKSAGYRLANLRPREEMHKI